MNGITAITLTAEQESSVWRMAAEPTNAALNTSGLGVGKTVVALEVAKMRNAQTILIIAPLGTRLGWKVTAERQQMNHEFYWIKTDKNKEEYLTLLKNGVKGIFFVGTEMFMRLGWEGKKRTKTWSTINPDMIVFDESHKASNRSTKTYKTLQLQTGENHLTGGFKLAMSATPSGNRFEGAWAIPRWLWPDDNVVPRSYDLWVGRWAATEYDPFSFSHKKIVGEKNPGEWYNSLPCRIHLEAEQKQVVTEERFVELTSKQRKIYDDLENDYVAWLGENPMVAELPITMRIRQRQTTLAEPIIDEEGTVSFADGAKSSKTVEVLNILENDIDGEHALIFSDSIKYNRGVLIPALVETGLKVGVWDGGVNQKDRETVKQQFINGDIQVIVATIPALAEGVDGLQAVCRNIIWVTRSENGVLNEQATGRIVRQGQKCVVREFVLTALDTHDQGSYKSLTDEALQRRLSVSR